MTKRAFAPLTLVLLLTGPSDQADAQTEPHFHFDQTLRTPSGTLLEGSHQITFRVFDAPAKGTLIAGPIGPLSLQATAGRVQAELDPFPPVALEHGRWLEVTVDGLSLPRTRLDLVYHDEPDENGLLTGGKVLLLSSDEPERTNNGILSVSTSTTIIDNGPPANRIDIVTVGDGYLASQMSAYHVHVSNGINALFNEEPFESYAAFFNVHRVEVISNEAGVDNDPSQGVTRDTALDMGFWCSGIERLLCVNTTKANQAAASAPESDQVLAVANSVKYGGAGYQDLATYSGGNISSSEVAIHEIGHSIGNLADEYFTPGTTYPSATEPSQPNVSKQTASAMAASGTKWAAWLGEFGIGFDGLVDTYLGGAYYEFGIRRPTNNSMMRSLGRPFNLPSVEALIKDFYSFVDPIDDATSNALPLHDGHSLFVDPVDPVLPLDVQWFVDGVPAAGATETGLDLYTLALPPGTYDVSATVTDNTIWVRDSLYRASDMTESRVWSVTSDAPQVAVLTPNGGESLTSGMSYDITWTATDSTGVDSVSIFYSTNGGASFAEVVSPAPPGGTYSWTVPLTGSDSVLVRVTAYDLASNSGDDVSDALLSIDNSQIGVPEGDRVAGTALLLQNSPNPFSPRTRISFSLPELQGVRLEVFDSSGRQVAVLLDDRTYEAGTHHVSWNGTNDSGAHVVAGVYFYRLRTGAREIVKRMILLQ